MNNQNREAVIRHRLNQASEILIQAASQADALIQAALSENTERHANALRINLRIALTDQLDMIEAMREQSVERTSQSTAPSAPPGEDTMIKAASQETRV